MQQTEKFFTYKHVSFDLWLTLIKSDSQYKISRNLLFKEFFDIQKPIGEIAAVIRKFDILTNTINEKVTRNFDTFEIYYLILDSLEIDIHHYTKQRLEEFYLLTEGLLMQYKPLLLNDSIAGLLKNLHEKGITMNILSNTAFIKGSSLRKIIAYYDLDDYFTFQIYSDEIGFSKPGVEIFHHAYERIIQLGAIEKHQVLHVGDNVVSDYNGAIEFGFHAHLITNKITDEYTLQPL